MISSKPNARVSFGCLAVALLLAVTLAACGPAPTSAPLAAATQQPAATATSVPPAATATAQPPTATAVPPTATAKPPTATAEPPTATAKPATATAQPAATTAAVASPSKAPAGQSTPASNPAAGAPPKLPHPVAGREQCLTCHDPKTGAVKAPANHEGRTNDLCLYCHVPADGKVTLAPLPDKPAAEFCLGCHGPFDQLAQRTANFTTKDGEKANPHVAVPHDSTKPIACVNCHDVHPLPVSSPAGIAKGTVQYCYSACHHQENFTPCSQCHEDMKKKP